MQTVTDIPIRFVSANSILNNLTSPLFMLICLAIVIACAGVLVYIFCKKTSMKASYANSGTSDSTSASPNSSAKSLGIAGFSKKSKIVLILIAAAFLACIAALTCTALNDKAIADSQSDLDSHEIIAYVDENDGDITLKNGALINNGSDGVEVIGVEPQQTTIKGKAVTINLNSDDVELYSNGEENNTQLDGQKVLNTSSEDTLNGIGVLNESYVSDTNNEGVTSNSSDDLSNEGRFIDSDDAEDLEAIGATSSNQQKGKSSTKPVDQSGTPSKEIIVDPNGGSIPISGSIKGLNSDDVKDIVDTYAPAAVTVTTKTQTNEMCIKKVNGYQGKIAFFPVFSDSHQLADKGIVFYEDEQGTKPLDIFNNLINDSKGCSMNDLSQAYEYAYQHGISVYAKAPIGTRFYSLAGTAWKDAFGEPTWWDNKYEFTDWFKNQLTSLGLPTTSVYTDHSYSCKYGHWDADGKYDTPEPTLEGIGYTSFIDAYGDSGLLGGNPSNGVWSSKPSKVQQTGDSGAAYVYQRYGENKWNDLQTDDWSYKNFPSVVLTLKFVNGSDKSAPSFDPDENMPSEGSMYSSTTVSEDYITSAVANSDGDILAYSSDENVATVSFTNTITDDGLTKITYKIHFVKSGYADIKLGVKGSDAYTECARTFKVKVSPPNVKPIQMKFHGQSVNFLPAVTDASWAEAGLNFYKINDDDETYTKLDNITSMFTLATTISAVGADKVYADITGATFYGTIDISWNEAFKSDTKDWNTSAGLNTKFAEELTNAGLETVYFDGNTSTQALSKWNWDSSKSRTSPTLNGVNYGTPMTPTTEFYGAYKGLLSSFAYYPSSSRAEGSDAAWYWYPYECDWSCCYRTYTPAVVLAQVF